MAFTSARSVEALRTGAAALPHPEVGDALDALVAQGRLDRVGPSLAG
jgi:hypothetical protein